MRLTREDRLVCEALVKVFWVMVVLLAAWALTGCGAVGGMGMGSVLGTQTARKAGGKTWKNGQVSSEWAVEGYNTDNTMLAKEAGKTLRFKLGTDLAESIIPQITTNPNVIPKNPNVIPRDPNVPVPIPANPNVIPVNPNVP